MNGFAHMTDRNCEIHSQRSISMPAYNFHTLFSYRFDQQFLIETRLQKKINLWTRYIGYITVDRHIH